VIFLVLFWKDHPFQDHDPTGFWSPWVNHRIPIVIDGMRSPRNRQYTMLCWTKFDSSFMSHRKSKNREWKGNKQERWKVDQTFTDARSDAHFLYSRSNEYKPKESNPSSGFEYHNINEHKLVFSAAISLKFQQFPKTIILREPERMRINAQWEDNINRDQPSESQKPKCVSEKKDFSAKIWSLFLASNSPSFRFRFFFSHQLMQHK